MRGLFGEPFDTIIRDKCRCGAEFYVRTLPSSATYAHEQWLRAHESCRVMLHSNGVERDESVDE